MSVVPTCYTGALKKLDPIPGFTTLLSKLELPELSPGLAMQVAFFVLSVYRIYRASKRWQRRVPEDEMVRQLCMMSFKAVQFFASREKRVNDIMSAAMGEVVKQKERLFRWGIPYILFCIDSRCNSKLCFGLHGKAIHTPAGRNATEFVRSADGEGLILRPGDFTRRIESALKKRRRVFEIFDSHRSCAACELIETKRNGESPKDGGLYADVQYKQSMAAATHAWFKRAYNSSAELAILLTTFDPHDGSLLVGLDQNLSDSRAMVDGFTNEVVEQLCKEGKALSTARLVAENEALRELLFSHYFSVDYTWDGYMPSTKKFWDAIEAMSGEGISLISDNLRTIFPRLNDTENEDELHQCALLVLANSFNYLLHNFDASRTKIKYPYNEHLESLISVTLSPQGPHDRAQAFQLYPEDPQLAVNMELARSIILDNRRNGRMSRFERKAMETIYPNGASRIDYPVLAVMFSRLSKLPDEDTVAELQRIDLSGIIDQDWMTMRSRELFDYLDEQLTGLPGTISQSIQDLRDRSAKLLVPGQAATDDIFDGLIILMCVVSGPHRENLLVVPLLTTGFRQ